MSENEGNLSVPPVVNMEGGEPPRQEPDKPEVVLNEELSNTAEGNPEKKEHTRSTLAILFVLGFFAIIFLCFIYALLVRASLNDLKDTLVGVIGALSGIFGFIVGYYYKSAHE